MWWVGYPLLGEPTANLNRVRFIPRRTLPVFEQGPARPTMRDINRLTSLLDDIVFASTDVSATATAGTPDPSSGAVAREGRYKYAWFVRRPNNSVRYEVELNVIVYNARTVDVSTPERVLRCDFTPGSTSATIHYNAATDKPALRRGQWILDSTMVTFGAGAAGGATPTPHGFFYRVVDVADPVPNPANANDLMLTVELQTPALAGAIFNRGGQVTILSNAAEVFNKGIVSPYTTPALQ
jgi:hypothetical protein